MRKLYSLVLVLFIVVQGFSQTSVSGKVLHEKTNEPIVYVNVYFEDKKVGTKTDGYGRFKLSSPKAESKLFFSSTEYDNKVINIKPNTPNSINVKLLPKLKVKQEVFIRKKRNSLPKDTIAIRIFRNIVKYKPVNKPKSFETYQYLEYSKLEIDIANIDSSITKNVLLKPFRILLENRDTSDDGEVFFPIFFKDKGFANLNRFVTRIRKHTSWNLIKTKRKVNVNMSHKEIKHSIFRYTHLDDFIHRFAHGKHHSP